VLRAPAAGDAQQGDFDIPGGGRLFLTIGIVPMQQQVGHFTKPVRFWPFCGTELQSAEEIAAWGKAQ